MTSNFLCGLRQLRRHPKSSIAAVVILAATCAAMTILPNAARVLWWNPLGSLESPEKLVLVWEQLKGHSNSGFSVSSGFYLELKRELGDSVKLGLSRPILPILRQEGESRKGLSLKGARVTPGFLAVLGVDPWLGRDLNEQDSREDGTTSLIVSHRVWKTFFGADRDLTSLRPMVDFGRGAAPARVVGVLPPSAIPAPPLVALDGIDVLSSQPTFRGAERDLLSRRSYRLLARVSSPTARTALEQRARILFDGLAEKHPGLFRHFDLRLDEAVSVAAEPFRSPLQILFVLMGLVAAAAGLNIAILWSARHQARLPEWEQRVALGAGFGSLLRLLIIESLIPALIAFPLGVVGAVALMTLPAMFGAEPPLTQLEPTLDDVGFALIFCLLMALLFSIPSALTLRRLMVSPSSAPRRSRSALWQRGLLLTEVALGVAIVTVTLGVAAQLTDILRTDLGFRHADVLTVDLRRAFEPDPMPEAAYYRRLAEAVREIPGVHSAGALRNLPLTHPPMSLEARIDGTDWRSIVHLLGAGPDALEALEVPSIAGRPIEPADMARDPNALSTAPVPVWINETLARLLPEAEAVGARFVLSTGQPTPVAVAGVVGDMRFMSPTEDPTPAVFIPISRLRSPQAHLVVRLHADVVPEVAIGTLESRILETQPEVIVERSRSMDQLVRAATKRERLMSLSCASLSALVLLLVLSGVWAVSRHRMETSLRDLAIRAALGAPPKTLQLETVRFLWGDILAGIAVGWLLALGVRRLMAAQLDHPLDSLPVAVAAGLIAALSLACAWLAGRRLHSVDLIKLIRDHV